METSGTVSTTKRSVTIENTKVKLLGQLIGVVVVTEAKEAEGVI